MTRSILTLALGIALAGAAASTASAQLLDKKTVSLAAAKKIAAAAEAEAARNNWNMVVSVFDDGGNLVDLERMDGAQLGSIDISQAKGRTALLFKRPSKAMQDALNQGNAALSTLPHLTAVQGGLPIIVDGKVIGSVGVSGGTSAQDEQCARAGIAALPEK
jgi:glc operon protein GlcG